MSKTNVQKHFGDLAQQGIWASLYSGTDRKITSETWSFLIRARCVLNLLAKHAAAGPVLDVGCGTAPIARAVHAMGRKYVGIDFAAEMVKVAQGLHTELGDDVNVTVGDVTHIEYGDGQFGAVVAMGVFEYLTVEQIRRALGEMRRVVRPQGCVIITIPKRWSWPNASYAALYPIRNAIRWRPWRSPTMLERQEEFRRLYMTPGELQKLCADAGMRRIAGQHYNAQVISRPFTVIAPRASYLVNRPFEALLAMPGGGFLGTGFIGVFRPA